LADGAFGLLKMPLPTGSYFYLLEYEDRAEKSIALATLFLNTNACQRNLSMKKALKNNLLKFASCLILHPYRVARFWPKYLKIK
jgi:hypothetical protein